MAVAEELGPAFVKLGQVLSTRPDLIPTEIIRELAKLQDSVSPFPTEAAREIISEDLGAPVESIFAEFPDEPLASGSIAQTYLAPTRDGERVVIKVRRPGIETVIRLDMHILRGLAQAAENLAPELRVYRPQQVIEELARTFQQELDFVHEASTTSRFHEAFSDRDDKERDLIVPRVHWELTGTRVLTIEYLDGMRLQTALDDPASIRNRPELARHLAGGFLDQYFDFGVFHADPHPGNMILIRNRRIGLVDFGMVGRLDDHLRVQLILALLASVRRDVDMVIDVLDEINALTEETKIPALKRDLLDVLEKYHGLPLRRIELGGLFLEVSSIIREHGVRLPRDFVLFSKSLVTVSGVALQLDPDLNLVELIRPRLRSMIGRQLSPDRWLRAGGMGLWHWVQTLRDAPRVVRSVIRRFERGQLTVQIRHQHLDQLMGEMDRTSNRIAFSVVLGSVIVGSSLVLHAKLGPKWGEDISILGLLGYGIAGLLGLWLLFAILRGGKLS